MGAITDWAAYAKQVAQSVHLPPPKPEDPPVDLNKIKTDYEANNGAMEQTRHEIETVDDGDPQYLEKLNKYQDLVDKQTKLLAQLEKLKEQGPPQGTDKGEFDKQVKDLEQKLGASVHGDNDGIVDDGGHDLGKGRILVRVGDTESGCMFGANNEILGAAGSDSRTLQLNRNKFDPNSADGNLEQTGEGQPRDADLVHDNDFVVVGVDPKVLQQAQANGDLPTKIDPTVKAHADQLRQPHVNQPDYASYADGMDKLLLSLSKTKLTPEQQNEALDRYEHISREAIDKKKPLSEENKIALTQVLGSEGFNKLPADTKNKGEELLKKYAVEDPKKFATLTKVLSDPGFQDVKDANHQKQILEKYDSDPRFRDAVNKFEADPKFAQLKPEERAAVLERLRGSTERDEYKNAANDGDRQKIINNAYKLATSDKFLKGDVGTRDALFDKLFSDGNQTKDDGADIALK